MSPASNPAVRNHGVASKQRETHVCSLHSFKKIYLTTLGGVFSFYDHLHPDKKLLAILFVRPTRTTPNMKIIQPQKLFIVSLWVKKNNLWVRISLCLFRVSTQCGLFEGLSWVFISYRVQWVCVYHSYSTKGYL